MGARRVRAPERGGGGRLDATRLNRVFHDHECDYYDERFAIVHDRRSARRGRRQVEDLLGRRLGRGEVVLDAGCGTGWLAAGLRRSMPGLVVVGTDLSAGMLDRARAAGGWPLLQADSQRLPLCDAAVDLVVTRGVLHHLPDVGVALREWHRVLRPGGAVVVCCEPTPAVGAHGARLVRGLLAVLRRPLSPEEDFWEIASMAANLHVFTPTGLAGLAADAGFTRVRVASTDFLATLVLTACYVAHGRAPRGARRLPWRAAERLGHRLDRVLFDRLLPSRLRHTVAAVLRP